VNIHVVQIDDARAMASLGYVMDHIDTEDHEVTTLSLDKAGRLDKKSRQIEQKFQHTPEPLLDAWRAARHLNTLTRPGDVVLISDHRGLGGIFALDQAAAEPGQRRAVWTVAADSAFLEMRLIANTHRGLPTALDSQIDWEITQYRWSERVISTSARALTELAVIDVTCELLAGPPDASTGVQPLDPTQVWAPGPVSRRNQTGEILRAITSIPAAHVIVSHEDSPDEIWTGSSWEALHHSRVVLGDRVTRMGVPSAPPGVIVLGDPYAAPASKVLKYVAEGVPVVVPVGSVAAAIWPWAPTWSQSDDLEGVLTGADRGAEKPDLTDFEVEALPRRGQRAQSLRVSVGIPVFRDVSYLRDCVESILRQDLTPIEILILDDGSNSDEVDEELTRVAGLDERVRIMKADHRGVCVARNSMMESMSGDAFVFVDSDDILLPSFVRSCAHMMESSEVWVVATWTEFFGAYEGIEAKPPFDQRVGRRENPIISTSALVDMRVREKGIRFSPDLAFLYCEDWHFWSQISAADGQFGLVPEPLARHRVHTSSGGFLRTDLAHAVGKARAIEPLLY